MKRPIEESSDADKVKYRELKLVVMTLLVEDIKENLVPLIENIDLSQEMYEALSKLFTIKNIGKVESPKNELRTTKMTKEDIVSSLFAKIARIRYELLTIDEIMPDKELVITTILVLPPAWGYFTSALNSWK